MNSSPSLEKKPSINRSTLEKNLTQSKSTPSKRKRSTTQTETIDTILLRISNDFSEVQPLFDLAKLLKVHPTYVILGVFLFLFVPINLGLFPCFFVNVLGFLYPSYMSMKTMNQLNKENQKQWVTYWLIFCFLEIFNGVFTLIFNMILPFFFPFKALFLIWLYYPKSKGATVLYEKVFRRLFEAAKSLKDDSVFDGKTEEFFKKTS